MVIRYVLAALAMAMTVACGPASADAEYHEHNETTQYTIDITYPLDYPDQKTVSDYVAADRADFLDWVDRFGDEGPVMPYIYGVHAKTYSSTQPATTSLVLTIDDGTGFAHEGHPERLYKSFNYDLAKQSPITLDTLFRPDVDVVTVLRPKVAKLYDRPTFELSRTEFENFAITDDAVIFFFGEGQLLPMDNTGPRQISVPRSELAPLLA
jgi:hypothetical protein